jgi:hypothetical protein
MNNQSYTQVSRKVPGRILETVSPLLTLYDHNTWQKVWRNFRTHIETIISRTSPDVVDIVTFNKQIADFIWWFIGCLEEFNIHMDVISFTHLVDFLIQVFLWKETFSNLQIMIWTGGTDYMPSVRMPIHLIPAVLLLRHIDKVSSLLWRNENRPQIVLFRAKNIAQYSNQLDSKSSTSSTDSTLHFLEAYISRFAPQYKSICIFTEDEWFQSMKSEIDSQVPLIENIVHHLGINDSLTRMWQKHGTWEINKSLFYAAAHAMYSQHLQESNWATFQISIWGQSEKIFHRICRWTDTDRSVATISLQKIRHPAYYLARDGDISLGQKPWKDCSIETFDPSVKDDILKILEETQLPLGEYLSFTWSF